MKDIDYALVEAVRPPIYTAMKYWGKKPHNIWRTYIENYTPEDGIYLDPFAGSAISIFESVKVNRKAIGFDLNPLTSFIIEVFATEFDKNKFKKAFLDIYDEVSMDKTYLKFFQSPSRRFKDILEVSQSFKWDSGKLYEIGLTYHTGKKQVNYTSAPIKYDKDLASEMDSIKIPFWHPTLKFPNSPSFTANFIDGIGGNNFSYLWTRRNLYVISKIFDIILKQSDIKIKLQLLFGFIQMIHLCTKMSVPRREDANRPFSTSWGRSAYICAARQMEMNPLLVFKSSCLGKQSVESSLLNVESYLGKIPKIKYVSSSNKNKNILSGFDIKYGIVDVNTLNDYIPENSIDFIMTDPPYGGLVQYLDLSLIWLTWLEHYEPRFKPNLDAEITIKKDVITLDAYKQRFTSAIKQLYKVLKPKGKIVFTFHNKDLQIWNAFLNSIMLSGFKIEKVIHQQNRRTGESNVANPYGTSATDFYIRCIKSSAIKPIKTDKDEFEHYVIRKAIRLIAERNEATPYQILYNGLLSEISQAGFDTQDFDANAEKILSKEINNTFIITKNSDNNAGAYWWFKNPSEHIKYPDKGLSERVEETISSFLRRKVAVSFDEVLAEIFIKYPNGLTPEIKSVSQVLKKYATQSGGKWLAKSVLIDKEFTRHTEILFTLSVIGKKMGYKIFIGKREQPESINNTKLSSYADYKDLSFLSSYSAGQIKRLEMIDMLWIASNKVEMAIEVENSTNFTSGIQRASNLGYEIPKIMVIPDYRESELTSITDTLFTENFMKYNWKYQTYTETDRLVKTKNITLSLLNKFLKCL